MYLQNETSLLLTEGVRGPERSVNSGALMRSRAFKEASQRSPPAPNKRGSCSDTLRRSSTGETRSPNALESFSCLSSHAEPRGAEAGEIICNYYHCVGERPLFPSPCFLSCSVRLSSLRPPSHWLPLSPPIRLSLSVCLSLLVWGANGIITSLSVLDKHQTPPITGFFSTSLLFSNLLCFYNGAAKPHTHTHTDPPLRWYTLCHFSLRLLLFLLAGLVKHLWISGSSFSFSIFPPHAELLLPKVERKVCLCLFWCQDARLDQIRQTACVCVCVFSFVFWWHRPGWVPLS